MAKDYYQVGHLKSRISTRDEDVDEGLDRNLLSEGHRSLYSTGRPIQQGFNASENIVDHKLVRVISH